MGCCKKEKAGTCLRKAKMGEVGEGGLSVQAGIAKEFCLACGNESR